MPEVQILLRDCLRDSKLGNVLNSLDLLNNALPLFILFAVRRQQGQECLLILPATYLSLSFYSANCPANLPSQVTPPSPPPVRRLVSLF